MNEDMFDFQPRPGKKENAHPGCFPMVRRVSLSRTPKAAKKHGKTEPEKVYDHQTGHCTNKQTCPCRKEGEEEKDTGDKKIDG